MRDMLALMLNFNAGQTNQDFTDAQLNDSLYRAYRREVRMAKLEGEKSWWLAFQDFTWAASTTTITAPDVMKQGFLTLRDVTEDEVGEEVQFSSSGTGGDVFWKDRNTLQWGTQGPGSERTLRVFYKARMEKWAADDDSPAIMPEEYHELIVYSAAIELRDFADNGQVPQRWLQERQETRFDYWKHAALGKAQHSPTWLEGLDSDVSEDWTT